MTDNKKPAVVLTLTALEAEVLFDLLGVVGVGGLDDDHGDSIQSKALDDIYRAVLPLVDWSVAYAYFSDATVTIIEENTND